MNESPRSDYPTVSEWLTGIALVLFLYGAYCVGSVIF